MNVNAADLKKPWQLVTDPDKRAEVYYDLEFFTRPRSPYKPMDRQWLKQHLEECPKVYFLPTTDQKKGGDAIMELLGNCLSGNDRARLTHNYSVFKPNEGHYVVGDAIEEIMKDQFPGVEMPKPVFKKITDTKQIAQLKVEFRKVPCDEPIKRYLHVKPVFFEMHPVSTTQVPEVLAALEKATPRCPAEPFTASGTGFHLIVTGKYAERVLGGREQGL
jgi:hypothetical protein